MLSPLEKALLASCCQWRTTEELQHDLALEFPFDRIPPTLSFLKRRLLVELLLDQDGHVRPPALYKQTELGQRVLSAQRRKEDSGEYWPERALHAV